MVFKLKGEIKEKITEIDYEFLENKTQFNVTLNGRVIVIYEHGQVYVNGKNVADWKE